MERNQPEQGSENAMGTTRIASAVSNLGHSARRERPDRDSEIIYKYCPLLLAFGIAIVDYLLVPTRSLFLIYLLLVTFAAWGGGTRTGLAVAGISLLGLFAHVMQLRETISAFTIAWNLLTYTTTFLLIIGLAGTIHSYSKGMARRYQERTMALEAEITERKQTEAQLHKTLQQLRQLADNIGDVFWMRDPNEMRMVYVSPAFEKVWGRTCRELYQSPELWLSAIHPEDRELAATAIRTRQAAGDYTGNYRVVQPDGTIRRVRDRAFPIRDYSGKVIRIVGLTEDITDRLNLEERLLEVSDREQARIGQDLHDSLCQKLVALAFDCGSLEQKLAAHSAPEAASVQQMSALLDDLITEARATARGLFPVQLETDGLASALQQLAANTSSRFKVDCRVQLQDQVAIPDNTLATHLYRIAQEAVNNAVKHSKCKTVSILLATKDNRVELQVHDDGVGMPNSRRTGGMGLHIMEYRARTIGGTLTIQPGNPSGTIVTCVAPQPTASTKAHA